METVLRFLDERGFSAETRDRYERALRLFLNAFPDGGRECAAEQVRAWLFSFGTWGNSSRHVALNAVRGYLRWRWGAEHPALSLRLRRMETEPQRVLSAEQVRALLESFDTSRPLGRRDLALAAVLLDTGLRASEVCRWSLDHLDFDHAAGLARGAVRIKGGRWGEFVLPAYTANLLAAWLGDRDGIAQPGVKTVFVSVGGRKPGFPLTRGGLQWMMRRRWAPAAGLSALAPHDLRRTFATLALRSGAPTRLVQVGGRWKRLEMVEYYSRSLQAADMVRYSPVQFALFGD